MADKKWKELKQQVHDRDKGKCLVCGFYAKKGSQTILQAAHVWAKQPKGGTGGPDQIENLISLCPNCHQLFDKMHAFYICPDSGELVWVDGFSCLEKESYAEHYDAAFVKANISRGFLGHKKETCLKKNGIRD